MRNYKEVIKKGYEYRIDEFSFYLRRKVIKMGESVMPHDVAEIMDKADNSGRFKHLLFNAFTSPFGKLLLMIDIYEGAGLGEIPSENKSLTIDNLQNYF